MATSNHSAPIDQMDFIDAANSRITQAQAVLTLLTTAGQDLKEGFEGLSHKTVMDSLWAVQDIIDQAKAAVHGFHQCSRAAMEMAQ